MKLNLMKNILLAKRRKNIIQKVDTKAEIKVQAKAVRNHCQDISLKYP